MVTMTTSAKISLVCLYFAFLTWLYFPIFNSYFATDDWVILWYSSKIPPDQPWRYFSMDTVWFYRPFQTLLYGLNWHLVGLEKWVFSAEALVMHFGICLLTGQLTRMLFGNSMGVLTALIFSVSCMSPDVLLWAANLNTLQHALTTLGTACLYLAYLKTKVRSRLWWACVLATANCLTKESSINLPLVLTSLWVSFKLQEQWQQPALVKPWRICHTLLNKNYWYSIAPFVGITVAYVGIHRTAFDNIEPYYKMAYEFAKPVRAVYNLFDASTYALVGIVTFPTQFSFSPIPAMAGDMVIKYCWFLPVIILIIGLYRQSSPLVLCVLFVVATLFPAFALIQYKVQRYFYLPSLGGALFLATLILPSLRLLWSAFTCKQALTGILKTDNSRIIGYVSATVLVYIIVTNIIAFQTAIQVSVQQAAFVQRAVKVIERNHNDLPENSHIILRLEPNSFFSRGMGATEMVGLATGRKDIIATTTDQIILPGSEALLQAASEEFFLEVFSDNPLLVRTDKN